MTIEDLNVYRKELTSSIEEFVQSSIAHTNDINDLLHIWMSHLNCARLLDNKSINQTGDNRIDKQPCRTKNSLLITNLKVPFCK